MSFQRSLIWGPDLVLEFLSSLEICKKGDISFFRWCEEIYESKAMGDKEFVAKHFWKEVTGRSDWVFYPKGETGQVATNDFRMLWWFVHGEPAIIGQLDFGRFLISAFIWERDHITGSITMGSLITIFAKHLGVALPTSTVLCGHALSDIRQMENNYKWLVQCGDKNYEWFVKGEGKDANKVLYARLPCHVTHLSNPNALLFMPGDSHSPHTVVAEPYVETKDLFAHKAYVPRDQSALLGPAHPYSSIFV
ncbi:Transcription elongation factor GreA 1 [Bienertia sinuspersici]